MLLKTERVMLRKFLYMLSKMNEVDKHYVSKVYKELAEFGSYPRLDL